MGFFVQLRPGFSFSLLLCNSVDRFHHWANPVTKQAAIRAGSVRLPARVADAVQAVFGLHGLPAPPRLPRLAQAPVQAPVTPAVLRARYQVGNSGVEPTGSAVNRQAVA